MTKISDYHVHLIIMHFLQLQWNMLICVKNNLTQGTITIPKTLVKYPIRLTVMRNFGGKPLPWKTGTSRASGFWTTYTLQNDCANIGMKGCQETYPDRKKGAHRGVFISAKPIMTPYLVPQECGMHMDTEWVEIYREILYRIIFMPSHW